MTRSTTLRLQTLEAREVPAAALFAEIRPDIWGSYPLNLTPSGNTLYFSADNGHGYELYATDGTPGSAHLLKDVKPGLGGSDPADFYAADGGVVYFTADDGTGRALWRSDGTAAGTTKVPGFPAGDTFGGHGYGPQAIGLSGSLYFLTTTPATGDVRLWMTNGINATTLLRDFGPGTASGLTSVGLTPGGLVAVTLVARGASVNTATVWVTDGTAVGTRLQQQPLTAHDPRYETVALGTGVEVSPGLFVHSTASAYATGQTATLWTSDGVNASSIRLLKAIPSDGSANSARTLVPMGGKLYFVVNSVSAANRGLWVTDGTAAGTSHLTLPVDFNFFGLQSFNHRLLLGAFDSTASRYRFWLTDGTAAGTTEVPLPVGPSGLPVLGVSVGQLPAGPGYPNGALLFHLGPDGRPYLTDGTAAGGRWADTAGLPAGYPVANVVPQVDAAGRAVTDSAPAGVAFGGAIYFQSPRIGDNRPELWKWDPGAAPSPAVAPKVTGVTVNDGSAQRSVITKLTVTFDRAVNLADGAVTLTSTNGPIPVWYVLNLDPQTVGGRTVLTITFGQANGAQIADGRLTLTVNAAKVTDAATGAAMAADYAYNFTKLYGDLNGDGVYDREARTLVHNSLGLHVGDAGYLVALDSNNDGVIDAADELAVVRNWGKSV